MRKIMMCNFPFIDLHHVNCYMDYSVHAGIISRTRIISNDQHEC